MTTQAKTPSLVLLAACFCSFVHTTAFAQEATRMRTDHAVGLEAGLESSFVTRLGYSHRAGFLGDDGRLFVRFTLPVVRPDLGDFALDGGARIHLLGGDGWGLQALGGPVLQHAENDLFYATALGLRASLLPGYQTESWGVLLDVGVEQMLATYLESTDLYTDLIYADAKNGFYALSSGTLHVGLRGGLRLGRVELSMNAGMASDLALGPQLPPFYLTLGTAYAL